MNGYQELRADLLAKRAAIDNVLASLDALDGAVVAPAKARPRNIGRTDGRNKCVTATASSTPHGERILAALKIKSPQSPAELAKQAKVARPVLTYHLKGLIRSGAVVATGATMNRQIGLPLRASAAKEAP